MPQADAPKSNDTTNIQSKPRFSSRDRLAVYLFFLSILIYLITRLVRLPDFPIFFFTDEAIQTQHAADLISRGFRSPEGILFPTYFENGGMYNLSLSVYTQVLPKMIFGKSIWITRGVSVFLSLTAAIALGLILKNIIQNRFWWLGTLLLAATPAWFLHSRTAFETVLMVSMYAGFLYFYLRYRNGKSNALYLSLIFGALAFYAYSPGQVIMVTTGLMLLAADWRYHWQHRKTALIGIGLLSILIIPYLRFILNQGGEMHHHLTLLNTYWIKPLPFYEKLLMFLTRCIKGLNPLYWFWPNPSLLEKVWPQIKLPSWLFSNQLDLARHTMKGYGHILLITFPLWVVGLVQCLRRFNDPSCRTFVLATLAAPSGAAIVDWGITRGMVFIIPAVLITITGFTAIADWLQQKWKKLHDTHIAGVVFVFFTILSLWMMADALKNGPTWFDDYGLSGMQYGGQQVFSRAAEIARSDPDSTVLVSSTWANGADVLMRYFTDDLPNVRMGNINAFGLEYRQLDRQLLFVMTEEDLAYIESSGKFTSVTVEEILPYPDHSKGFYFVRLEYVPEIREIMAAEHAARQALQEKSIPLLGQQVAVKYSTLDMNEIQHAFDGDPITLIRTLEANPLQLILTFPEPIDVQSVSLLIGGTPTRATVSTYAGGEKKAALSESVGVDIIQRELQLQFNPTQRVDRLEIEILNTHDGEIAHVHLWEVRIE